MNVNGISTQFFPECYHGISFVIQKMLLVLSFLLLLLTFFDAIVAVEITAVIVSCYRLSCVGCYDFHGTIFYNGLPCGCLQGLCYHRHCYRQYIHVFFIVFAYDALLMSQSVL